MSNVKGKILGIDASRAAREQKTGVETYAANIIEALFNIIPSSFAVKFYCDRVPHNRFAHLPPTWQWRQLGKSGGLFWTQRHLSWEMLRRPPDVLFVPAHVLPIISPRRTAVMLHDVAFLEKGTGWYTPLSRAYNFWGLKQALRRADLIFTISDFSKRELIEKSGAAPEKIIVTPLGVAHERFKPQSQDNVEAARQKYNLTAPYILYVGRLEAKKNIIGLLRAFEKVVSTQKDLCLVLAGKAGVGFGEIKKELSKMRFRERVILLGFVAEDSMPALYAGSSAFVFPSWYEGFGLPILEAMAVGTPVVTSNRTALPEVAGEAAHLVDPADFGDIAAGINRLLEDRDYAENLRQKGFARAREFTWSRAAELTWQGLSRLF